MKGSLKQSSRGEREREKERMSMSELQSIVMWGDGESPSGVVMNHQKHIMRTHFVPIRRRYQSQITTLSVK